MVSRQQHVVAWNFEPITNGASFVFNTYAQPVAASQQQTFLNGDRPPIRLTPIYQAPRHAAQAQRIQEKLAAETNASAGQVGDWRAAAAVIYEAALLAQPLSPLQPPPPYSGQQPVLGVTPDQPIDLASPQFHDAVSAGTTELPTLRRLCLFHMLLACEWWPIGRAYQRQLMWALRRMSDFLFDVTDGYMALGTVAIGGPAWLDCADIQLLSSNRLHPRSWVSGMQIPEKYMPIRIGRGFWSKRNRRATTWEEPEGYRTLTHEWGHYALGLKDHYMDRVGVDLHSGSLLPAQTAAPEAFMALPTISLPLETVMSVLEGTSELVDNSGGDGKQDEWSELRKRFPDLGILLGAAPDQGPGSLPLPLPEIGFIDLPADQSSAPERRFFPPVYVAPSSPPATTPDPNSYPAVLDTHCWVFTLRGPLSAPERLVAHGILDARAASDGFVLLGAALGDMIILIADGYLAAPQAGQPAGPLVLRGTLGGPAADGSFTIAGWSSLTPDVFPLADVHPDGAYDPQRHYRVRVALDAGGWRGWLFPLEQAGAAAPLGSPLAWNSAGLEQDQSIAGRLSDAKDGLISLDGHILLTSGGDTPALLTIASYSIGGGPQSINPPYTNPIPAGSSEGNALLFFHDEQASVPSGPDDDVPLVITTRNYGIALHDPALEPRSYTFSFASNMPLPDDREATLVMFVDRETADDDAVELQRYVGGAQPWQPIAALYRKDLSLVAAPLYDAASRFAHSPASEVPPATAPGLIGVAQAAERYRLVVRRAQGEG